jgi:hypothetical protein
MPVSKVGDRTVLEAGSIVINDPAQIATVEIGSLKFEFAAVATPVPPSANFFVPDALTGRFFFVGMLPGQDYFFTFKSIGYFSDRYFDLDVSVRCIVYDRITTPVFRVDYIFVNQSAPPPAPTLPQTSNALLGRN